MTDTLYEYALEDEYYELGGYSWIHFGERIADKVAIAVKFSRESDPTTLARFKLENKIMHELKDIDYIVNAFTGVLHGYRTKARKHHYYVMEKADCSFSKWLELNSGVLTDKMRIEVLCGVFQGLIAIHERNYVHRDLHSENVLMFKKLDEHIPKIADFGKAYDLSKGISLTRANKPAWGAALTPPEILFGVIQHDDPAYKGGDFYAFGMLIHTSFFLGLDGFSLLFDMHKSLDRFQRTKLPPGALTSNYFRLRSDEERLADYKEWCQSEEDNVSDRYNVNRPHQRLNDIIKATARLDYTKRVVDVSLIENELNLLRQEL
ncbi:protein kinase family protein [bacterium]|nr:MAG: protein kinase family protein [bacterium]